MEAEAELDKFGRPYPPKQGGYHVPFLAVDAIVTRQSPEGVQQVLMITRKKEPDVGKYALPGGHLEYDEDPEEAVLRELEEECGIKGSEPKLMFVEGDPQRDARKHMISIMYKVTVPNDSELVAASDAATAEWVNVPEIHANRENIAFDHFKVIDYLMQAN